MPPVFVVPPLFVTPPVALVLPPVFVLVPPLLVTPPVVALKPPVALLAPPFPEEPPLPEPVSGSSVVAHAHKTNAALLGNHTFRAKPMSLSIARLDPGSSREPRII
jgi:hypothetical protein